MDMIRSVIPPKADDGRLAGWHTPPAVVARGLLNRCVRQEESPFFFSALLLAGVEALLLFFHTWITAPGQELRRWLSADCGWPADDQRRTKDAVAPCAASWAAWRSRCEPWPSWLSFLRAEDGSAIVATTLNGSSWGGSSLGSYRMCESSESGREREMVMLAMLLLRDASWAMDVLIRRWRKPDEEEKSRDMRRTSLTEWLLRSADGGRNRVTLSRDEPSPPSAPPMHSLLDDRHISFHDPPFRIPLRCVSSRWLRRRPTPPAPDAVDAVSGL